MKISYNKFENSKIYDEVLLRMPFGMTLTMRIELFEKDDSFIAQVDPGWSPLCYADIEDWVFGEAETAKEEKEWPAQIYHEVRDFLHCVEKLENVAYPNQTGAKFEHDEITRKFVNTCPMKLSRKALDSLDYINPNALMLALALKIGPVKMGDNQKVTLNELPGSCAMAVFRAYNGYLILEAVAA